MKLSAFTPVGQLRLSGATPLARRLYDAMIAALGGQYDVTAGTHVEASIFAKAKGLATSLKLLEHAGAQHLPHEALEMLAEREVEYGLTPSATDSIAERRSAYAARKLLPLGASQNNVTNALRALLGADFIAYRPTPVGSAVLWPTTIGATEMNLQLPTTPRKLIRLTKAITTPGARSIPFIALSVAATPTRTLPVAAGDVLLVQPENPTRAERAVVTSVVESFLTATFAKAHDVNCLATSAPFPLWTSTKRHSLIVLTASAAADLEKRRRVNELMERMARGVSTWSICAGTSSSTSGPFKVGQGKLGITTIGAVTL